MSRPTLQARLSAYLRFQRGACLFLFSSFLANFGSAIAWLYFNFYFEQLRYGQQTIGLFNALPGLVTVAFALPVGLIVDRTPKRNLLLLGSAGSAACIFALALTRSYWGLITLGLLYGLATTFTWVSFYPFLMLLSPPESRSRLFGLQFAIATFASFLGATLGGLLPVALAPLLGFTPKSLPMLRTLLLISGAVSLTALIPLLLLTPDQPPPRHRRRPLFSPVSNWKLVAKLLAPAVLVSLGAGQVMPFLNLFLEGKFHRPYHEIGPLLGLASLLMAPASLLQPLLADRVGKPRSTILTQLFSLPFLFFLGFSGYFPLVVLCLCLRSALMNMGYPVYAAFILEQVPEEERGAVTSIETIAWAGGFALASWLGGWTRERLGLLPGFDANFAFMIATYLLSMILLSLFWGARRYNLTPADLAPTPPHAPVTN
jgi:MFS family permease